MEQSLLTRLLNEAEVVMGKYDLHYSEDALTKMLSDWWLQQVGANRAAA